MTLIETLNTSGWLLTATHPVTFRVAGVDQTASAGGNSHPLPYGFVRVDTVTNPRGEMPKCSAPSLASTWVQA